MKKKKNSKVVNKKVVNKKAPLTKSLGELIKDEDGFVSKENILKVGLSTVAALGISTALTDITSGCGWTPTNTSTHSNSLAVDVAQTNCVNHTNVTTHTSY